MRKSLENLLRNEIDPAFAKRARFIFEEIERSKPKRVLDAGCGRGFYVNSLTNFEFIKEIHGVDIVEKYLKIVRQNSSDKRINVRKTSLYSLPYRKDFFDFIICTEVLEHLRDDKKVISELKRVLKPGGVLIITVPNRNFPLFWDPLNWFLMKLFNTHVDKNIWWLAGIWADHERLYSDVEIEKLAITSGFSLKKKLFFLRYCIPFSHFLLYGIGKNLIERFGLSTFSRFNNRKTSILSQILALFFSLPENFLAGKNSLSRQSMNIGLLLKKE